MKKPTLTVVTDDTAPMAKPVPETISAAVQDGDSRDVLASMRKALAKKLDDGDIASNAIASAYKELRELDRLIRIADADLAEEAKKREGQSAGGRRSFDPQAI